MTSALVAAILLASTSFAQPAAGSAIGGAWTVRWDNGTANALTLTEAEGRLSGVYIDDSKHECAAAGNFNAESRLFAVQVTCPAWTMRMQGQVAENAQSAGGEYQAFVNSSGLFAMSRAPTS